MIPQSKAKIFPADERGISESDGFRSRYSFNFQNYQHPHKTAFGNLSHLNDDVLAAQQSLQFVAAADMYLVLIPVIEAICYHDDKGNEAYLVAGYAQLFAMAKDTVFALLNPYHGEAVNVLQLWIHNERTFTPESISPVQIELNENLNRLQTVLSHPQFHISLGKFGGRQEGSYQRKNRDSGMFTFIIDGQMEMQYRLLRSRDGLGLWEQDDIEWESLTASSILLVAEVRVVNSEW